MALCRDRSRQTPRSRVPIIAVPTKSSRTTTSTIRVIGICPLAPYPLVCARAASSIMERPFEVAQVVQTTERIPGIGMLQNPLLVGPAISVCVSPPPARCRLASKSFAVHVHWFTATSKVRREGCCV